MPPKFLSGFKKIKVFLIHYINQNILASKIWYSFMEGVSEDDHIGFYDSSKLPWVKLLEDNWKEIAEEIVLFIQDNESKVKPYFNENLVTKKKSWKTFTFFVWGWKVKKNMKLCPKTNAILTKIPHVVSASVSIMEPQVTIKPHRGDTNAIMRSHLALHIPASLPECGFKVKYEERSWQEGKVLVFNDAAWHTAWNHTDQRRYIMIIDVMRPEFEHKKYRVCSMVLGSLTVQFLVGKIGILKKFPRIIKGLFLLFFAGIINLVLRIRYIS